MIGGALVLGGSATMPSESANLAAPKNYKQLVAAKQQQIASDFQSDFTDKWTARTVCAPAETIELCSNYVVPEQEPSAGQPAPPPVLSRKPIEPGSSTISIDGSPQQGLPQGPQPPPAPEGAGQLPAGAVPLGTVLAMDYLNRF